jgi:hypothetical protein
MQEARDAFLRNMNKMEDATDWTAIVADKFADQQTREFRKWELDYDVLAEVSFSSSSSSLMAGGR